ncbi:MAG: Alpha-amylase, partial [Actinomycetota bacterium]
NDTLHKICTKGDGLLGLLVYYSWNQKHWPDNSIRMTHTSNHDKNSWEGTEFELFGNGVKAAIAFSFVSEGMPLIYNGQEAGNEKRLEFFEKDPIQWKQHEHGELFRRLIQIKKEYSCLDVAPWGARMQEVKVVGSDRVFTFVRENEKEKIFVALNFSDNPQKISFQRGPQTGQYKELLQGWDYSCTDDSQLDLEPWGFRIFGLKK